MKKLITMLLIMAMILPACALADLPDISGLSSDELLELNHQIQNALFSDRITEGVKVPPGTYIIGEDIPAGTYRIEITGGTGYYDIRFSPGGNLIHTGLTGKSYGVLEIGKIIFEEGNELYICNSTFVLFPYVGLFY